MTSYLLTWNPKKWGYERYRDYHQRFLQGEALRWSCGTTQKIMAGDSCFLLKQGQEAPGVVGRGRIVASPYRALHYDEDRAERGDQAWYVDVKFDCLMAEHQAPAIHKQDLLEQFPGETIWNTQGSGKTLAPDVAQRLSELLQPYISIADFCLPDEVPAKDANGLVEGALKQITVNAYERNQEARRRCLAKWGHHCAVCHFHFELFFGPAGKDYIHVHHLKPLHTIGEVYQIDPENDLRPVCPNCHAMLHRGEKPLSIEELETQIKLYGTWLAYPGKWK